jgi:predicted ArsR family transcriptional regulator
MDGFDRLYETARALGEETRFNIYRAICISDDPIAVSSLADTFSLHPNAIRQHLARLEQAGLVVSRADRDGVGAGRPRRLYESSPRPLEFTHPPHSMRSLVAVLAEAIDALPSDHRTLVRFGRSWGRSWATRRKRELNGSSPRSRRGRAELLARELRDWGWRPTTTREGPRMHLSTGHCLFREVIGADTNGRCCALEEGLLSGLVEALVNGHAKVVRADGCHLSVVV